MQRETTNARRQKEMYEKWRRSNGFYDEPLLSAESPPPSRGDSVHFRELRRVESSESYLSVCQAKRHQNNFNNKSHVKLQKLKVVVLPSISITPGTATSPHVLNLKQEFTFPRTNFAQTMDSSTQTRRPLDGRTQTPFNKIVDFRDRFEHTDIRPLSYPMANQSNHSFKTYVSSFSEYRVINNDCIERIGDGIDNNVKQVKFDINKLKREDSDMSDKCPNQLPVKSVIVKPKKPPTPLFKCKKAGQRPTSRPTCIKDSPSIVEEKSSAIKLTKKSSGTLKKSNSSRTSKLDITSSESNNLCNVGGCNYVRLCKVIEQLQDIEWDVCMDGLRNFLQVASLVNWESEACSRFIPVVNRRLIEFFKSPRSNLCRTACQVAGEFFLIAKSTKRPEFDEIVDILLCKTADANKFIQKDANVALDKMASCISAHHAVRAVCAKGLKHKNPLVRAATARLLTEICRKAGIEEVTGTSANANTRKRVMASLATALMDKNLETRKYGEQLCRLLKSHKFFTEYFFKDVENKLKAPLKKIIQQMK